MAEYLIDLQRFAQEPEDGLDFDVAPEADPEDGEIDPDFDDTSEPDLDEDELDEEDISEEDEDGEVELDDSNEGGDNEPVYPKSRVEKMIQQRLARERRKQERLAEEIQQKTLDELKRYAGDNLNEAEIKEAMRFYAFLKANPQHSEQINLFLSQNPWQVVPTFREDHGDPVAELRREIELRDTLHELRGEAVFRKYEQQIMEYAEVEGFDPRDPKDLRRAYKAWRGDNMRLLAANARLEGQRQATTSRAKGKRARLQGNAGPRGRRPVDYTKLSDSEILAREGLSLFIED